MVKCELCGKEFKTVQGLRGHQQWVHENIGKRMPLAAQPAAEHKVGKLQQLLRNTIEHAELQDDDNPIASKPKPVVQQVAELADKLDEYTEQVDKRFKEFAEQLEIIRDNRHRNIRQEAESNAVARKLETFQSEYEDAHNKLIAVVNKNIDTTRQLENQLNARLEKFDSQQKNFMHKILGVMTHLADRVIIQQKDILELKRELTYVNKLAI